MACFCSGPCIGLIYCWVDHRGQTCVTFGSSCKKFQSWNASLYAISTILAILFRLQLPQGNFIDILAKWFLDSYSDWWLRYLFRHWHYGIIWPQSVNTAMWAKLEFIQTPFLGNISQQKCMRQSWKLKLECFIKGLFKSKVYTLFFNLYIVCLLYWSIFDLWLALVEASIWFSIDILVGGNSSSGWHKVGHVWLTWQAAFLNFVHDMEEALSFIYKEWPTFWSTISLP